MIRVINAWRTGFPYGLHADHTSYALSYANLASDSYHLEAQETFRCRTRRVRERYPFAGTGLATGATTLNVDSQVHVLATTNNIQHAGQVLLILCDLEVFLIGFLVDGDRATASLDSNPCHGRLASTRSQRLASVAVFLGNKHDSLLTCLDDSSGNGLF